MASIPPTEDRAEIVNLANETRKLAAETNHLAQAIANIEGRNSIFTRPYRYLLFSFLNGLFVVLGSTVGVALLVWLLQRLGFLPLLGDLSKNIANLVHSTK